MENNIKNYQLLTILIILITINMLALYDITLIIAKV